MRVQTVNDFTDCIARKITQPERKWWQTAVIPLWIVLHKKGQRQRAGDAVGWQSGWKLDDGVSQPHRPYDH